jgi:hypothetical protein
MNTEEKIRSEIEILNAQIDKAVKKTGNSPAVYVQYSIVQTLEKILTDNPDNSVTDKPFDFLKYKDLLIQELMAEKVKVKQLRIIERIWDVATKAAQRNGK